MYKEREHMFSIQQNHLGEYNTVLLKALTILRRKKHFLGNHARQYYLMTLIVAIFLKVD